MNCEGLRSKLHDRDFIYFMQAFDVICLTETHMKCIDIDMYDTPGFVAYTTDATKLSKTYGRLSGGVTIVVKEDIQDSLHRIPCDIENIVVLKMDSKLIGSQDDVILIACYLPPHDSKFWKASKNGYGIEVLERCFTDLYSTIGDFQYILTGDFNARTMNWNMVDIDFEACTATDEIHKDYLSTDYTRASKDTKRNAYGEELLEFCSIHEGVILNGLVMQKFDGEFTCIKSAGSSVVDYFILSTRLLHSLHIVDLDVKNELFSDHLPVVLTIEQKLNEERELKSGDEKISSYSKISWQREKAEAFIRNFNSEETKERIRSAYDVLPYDAERSIMIFTDSLIKAAEPMTKKTCLARDKVQKRKPPKEYKNKEYTNLKHKAQQTLSCLRTTGSGPDREAYFESKKEFKNIKRQLKAKSEREEAENLASHLCNSENFWKDVSNIVGYSRKDESQDKISVTEWKEHFEYVFSNTSGENVSTYPDIDMTIEEGHELNKTITNKEVEEAISNLNNGKSGGTDKILPEMLKRGGKSVTEYLTALYNVIYNSRKFPYEWSKAIVIPIHKKGRKDLPDNYRGISLINMMCKGYTSILTQRLNKWVEEKKLLCDEQAGFRKKFSTVDQIFTLHAVIQKSLNKTGQKVYVAFVDMRKAFDSVNHSILFKRLRELGINGKFLSAIITMYSTLKACVRDKYGNLSDFFNCPVGVRQGCILSPILFSIFINCIAEKINMEGKHGVQLLPGLLELYILLFADDIALISQSVSGLQKQLDLLKSSCDKLLLHVNEDKTKVMIFRNGGIISRQEKWTYGGKPLEIVNNYCYLGYIFTTRLSVIKGTKQMTIKGKKAFGFLLKMLLKTRYISKECFFKVFDSKVLPILTYAAEVWGMEKLDAIERVHMMACKHFLGVPITTPNKIVYGELGRYPLYITTYVRSINFWLRMQTLEDSRITKKAYNMLLNMDSRGITCWATKIRKLLSEAGFYYVWLYQGVGHQKTFVHLLKDRLICMFRQEWAGQLRDGERYRQYTEFKTLLEPERYLSMIDYYPKRIVFTKARANMLPINANIHRYSNIIEDRYCNFCDRMIETEQHVLYHCRLYINLRTKFLGKLISKPIHKLLEGSNRDMTFKVAAFLFHAMVLRKRNM